MASETLAHTGVLATGHSTQPDQAGWGGAGRDLTIGPASCSYGLIRT